MFGRLVRCECKAREDAEKLQRLSGLTETERKWKLGDIDISGRPDTRKMLEACARFLDHPVGSVVLYGKSGNAKTIALQACVNALVSVGVEAVYITAFDLLSYVREAFNDNREVKSESDYERLLRFATVQFLAIDEFDKIKMTEWTEQEITDLIDRRYRLAQDGKAGTMIAMNGDPRDLPPWIYSRLSQGKIILNNDSDLRPHLRQA
jgi:DNA replication protein DnaC